MLYIDRCVEEGTVNQIGNWEIKEQRGPNCKIWARYAGSEINNKIPMMKTEHYFLNVDNP